MKKTGIFKNPDRQIILTTHSRYLSQLLPIGNLPFFSGHVYAVDEKYKCHASHKQKIKMHNNKIISIVET